MNYTWNKPLADLPQEPTAIWSCTKADCNGWIRAGFSFEEVPLCSQCKSAMVSSTKVLPILISSRDEIKLLRKNQRTKDSS